MLNEEDGKYQELSWMKNKCNSCPLIVRSKFIESFFKTLSWKHGFVNLFHRFNPDAS